MADERVRRVLPGAGDVLGGAARLREVLRSALPPGYRVTLAWAWKPRRDEFIPDVIVYPDTDEAIRFTGMPALVVEVVSPTAQLREGGTGPVPFGISTAEVDLAALLE